MKQISAFLLICLLAVGLESFAFSASSTQSIDLAVKKKDSNKDKNNDKNEEKEDGEKEEKKKVEINEADFGAVSLGALLASPAKFIGKKLKLTGVFSAFTTLALDYPPALRDSKEYISITIFRPDTKIPLAELKMAYPVEDAKDNELIKDLDEGDTLEIFGEVFSAALDEPWVDIVQMKKIADASPDKKDEVADNDQDENNNQSKDKNKKKDKQEEEEE